MKRLRWTIALLFLLVAGIANADSIQTFKITQALAGAGPNDGSGDNAGLEFFGPGGFKLLAAGGTGSYGFTGDTFSAGDPVGGFVMDWFDFSLTIGKTTYDPDTVDLSLVQVDPHGALTVPGGCVPATLSNGNGNGPIQLSAGSGDQFIKFNLITPPGTLCLSFDPVQGNPSLYQFTAANFFAVSTVPEPGIMSLMATGLAGIFGVIRKKRACIRT